MTLEEFIDITRNIKFGDIIKISYYDYDYESNSEDMILKNDIGFVLGIYNDMIAFVKYDEYFNIDDYDKESIFKFDGYHINIPCSDIISINEKYNRVIKLNKILNGIKKI